MKKHLRLDPYVHSTLMRDLVGHDHRPACFLVYIWLALEQQRRATAVAISYSDLADETGLSRSTAQSAVKWLLRRRLIAVEQASVTATPVYTTNASWKR